MPGSLARDARTTLWVGRLVRCRAASRAALPSASHHHPPENRDTNTSTRERNALRRVDAIAPRHGCRGASRGTRNPLVGWTSRPMQGPVGWTSRPMQGGVPRRPVPCKSRPSSRESKHEHLDAREKRPAPRSPHRSPARMPGSLARDARPTCGLDVPSDAGRRPAPPCPVQVTPILPKIETRTPRRAREAPCAALTPSLPGTDAGEPRAGRATHSRATHLWVGRLVRCRAASRAALSRASHDDPPENRDTNTSTRERSALRHVDAIAPRHGCRGASRGTRDPLARDPLCGLDVSSDAGRRPAPPCPVQVTTILPRIETRTPRRARGTPCAALTPSLPGTDAGEPRAGRATHSRATHLWVGRLVRCSGLWVGRPVRCRAASRAALSRASHHHPPENRDTNTSTRERSALRRVDPIAPRHGCRGASRGTRDPLARDPLVGWTSRPMQGGVPRRPARCKSRPSSRESRHEHLDAREERPAPR